MDKLTDHLAFLKTEDEDFQERCRVEDLVLKSTKEEQELQHQKNIDAWDNFFGAPR